MKRILSSQGARVLLGMAALSLLSLIPSFLAVNNGEYPFSEDSLALFAPWRMWTAQSLGQGILPLWNPHFFGGMPFMSNGQTSVLYPFNVVYWVLPIESALLVDALLHSIVLGCGGYFLARSLYRSQAASWLCAICLLLGNGVAAHLFAGHMTWHAARAYLPFIVWALICFLRQRQTKYLWTLALFFALQVFAGYPPYVLWSVCWCLVFSGAWWWACRHRHEPAQRKVAPLQIFLPALLLVFLCASVVLPLRETNRQGRTLTFKDAVTPSSTVNGWVRLALPNFFGGNQNAQWSIVRFPHEEAAYIGLLPLGLALFAPLLWRWRRSENLTQEHPEGGFDARRFSSALWWILPIALLLALGKHTPLYRVAFDYFPPLRLFRAPARWLEIWYFAACVLAAFGLDAALKLEFQRAKRIVAAATCAAFLFVGIAVVIFASQPQSHYWMEVAQWNDRLADSNIENRLAYARYLRFTALQSAVVASVLALILTLLLNRLLQAPEKQKAFWTNALLSVIAAELLLVFWTSARFVKNAPPQNPWTHEIIKSYRPGERWNTAFKGETAAFGLNLGLPHNIDILGGYDTMAPRRFFEFASAVEHRKFWGSAYQAKNYDPLWRVAGVTHVLASPGSRVTRQLTKGRGRLLSVTGNGETAMQFWKIQGAWPRVFLTSQVLCAPREKQLPLLREQALHGPPAAIVETSAFTGLALSVHATGKVLDWQRKTNQATAEIETNSPQVLVWSETNSPGWRVWVNGRAARIESTNYLFRGVKVPAGKSHIAFIYDNQTHRAGLFFSLCGLSLLAGALSFVASIRRMRPPE